MTSAVGARVTRRPSRYRALMLAKSTPGMVSHADLVMLTSVSSRLEASSRSFATCAITLAKRILSALMYSPSEKADICASD